MSEDTAARTQNIVSFIRDIPDFPTAGIIFKDITPLLADAKAFDDAITLMTEPYKDCGGIDYVASLDARGFIFGSSIARELGAGFVPLRKKGKLPHQTISYSYSLEYGSNEIEIHVDAVKPGDRVLIVDDLLATGGTLKAACSLIEQLGGDIIGISVLVELGFLEGRKLLEGYRIDTVVKY